ncbi:uncharacterized protein CDAR_532441 [Caerostris darwini]|uniref:Ig-like domain-containing protein n=1 Tax=Caerostris darwini TaxID=1538125 RepID=A0AAV4Q980_9ARAC|nr:uncharacterized protein CDAR_532441 [Caerostris darwini]
MPLILLAGEEYEFSCETRGSRPRALTTWWLDGHKITAGLSDMVKEARNVTISTLHFTPYPRDNGKRLLCKSANPALPKATVEDERTLRVQSRSGHSIIARSGHSIIARSSLARIITRSSLARIITRSSLAKP